MDLIDECGTVRIHLGTCYGDWGRLVERGTKCMPMSPCLESGRVG